MGGILLRRTALAAHLPIADPGHPDYIPATQLNWVQILPRHA
jgi:hypothetical protein